MSDLPKCRLCGADAAVHKVFGGIKYCCSSETCTMHDVLMLKNQWRTLMTQQQPDQGRLRFKSACEISGDKHPEYVRGYEAAMDAVCRARKQQAEPVEYQRRMRPLWDSQEVWTPWEKCTKGTYDDCIRVPVLHDWEHQVRALYTAPQAQPAPIPTSWQPIETAPTDVFHVRGLWVHDKDGAPLYFETDAGFVDDDGHCFIDSAGNVYGWAAYQYTHWHPLAIPPAPGGSDE